LLAAVGSKVSVEIDPQDAARNVIAGTSGRNKNTAQIVALVIHQPVTAQREPR